MRYIFGHHISFRLTIFALTFRSACTPSSILSSSKYACSVLLEAERLTRILRVLKSPHVSDVDFCLKHQPLNSQYTRHAFNSQYTPELWRTRSSKAATSLRVNKIMTNFSRRSVRILVSNSKHQCLPIQGCNFMARKLATSSKPTIEISIDKDLYTIKTIHVKNTETSFRLGEEFEQINLKGDTVKAVIDLSGNSLIEKQFGEKPVEAVWEGLGDRLNVTRSCNNVTSVQKFVRE